MTLKNIAIAKAVAGTFVAALVMSSPLVASAGEHAPAKKAAETKCAAGDKACAEKAAAEQKDAHAEHKDAHGEHKTSEKGAEHKSH